jgi:thiol-disulfide isomerase/thioredoxin
MNVMKLCIVCGLWLCFLPLLACSQTSQSVDASTCIGVKPASSSALSQKVTCEHAKSCLGKLSPSWKQQDFQPQSCGYRKDYGIDSFRGHVTLVVLLSAWCGYCQGQAEKLERMRVEWELAGKKVHILVVNSSDADADQQKLVERCSFPLFQDTGNTVWGALKGKKDDFFVYDTDGKLTHYFSSTDSSVNTDLSTTNGYKTIKDAVETLLK